jgi:hypothetical protein
MEDTHIRTHRKGWLSSHQLAPPETTIRACKQPYILVSNLI